MKNNFSHTRRAHLKEYKLIKNTARHLARRFNTTSRWIEVILINTIVNGNVKLQEKASKNEIGESILDDNCLHEDFIPSLIESLSTLGVAHTMTLFEVDTSKYVENDINESTSNQVDDRQFTKAEKLAVEQLIHRTKFFPVMFNSFPPPICYETEPDLQDTEQLLDVLTQFKCYLEKYKNNFLYEPSTSKIPPFDLYPWFNFHFSTNAQVVKVKLIKGLLNLPGQSSLKFFKDEEERKDFLVKEQEMVQIPVEEYVERHLYAPRVMTKIGGIDLELVPTVKDADILLRTKLFALRHFLVDELIRYFSDSTSRAPHESLFEYIKNEFSRSEYSAIVGNNKKYFGIPADKRYSHLDNAIFFKLANVAFLIPFVFENRKVFKYHKALMPLYEFSSDVSGPHLLNFTYFDCVSLLEKKSKIDDIFENLDGVRLREFSLGNRCRQEFLNFFESEVPKIVENISAEVSTKISAGTFNADYSYYTPKNKKNKKLYFTPKQAEVIKILMDRQDRKATVSQLVKELYSSSEAKEILNKMAKAKSAKPKKRNEYKYEWRLEKGILKSNHPVWKIGMIKIGTKKGSEKWYYLDFSFEKIK